MNNLSFNVYFLDYVTRTTVRNLVIADANITIRLFPTSGVDISLNNSYAPIVPNKKGYIMNEIFANL